MLACIIDHPDRFAPKAWESEVGPEFFHAERNASLFSLLMQRTRDGLAVDPASLREAIRHDRPEGLTVGYILDVINAEKDSMAWGDYVTRIRDAHSRRVLMTSIGGVGDVSGMEALNMVRAATETASAALAGLSAMVDAKSAIDAFKGACSARKEEGKNPGLSTGIDEFDNHTGGMRPGELWVVGAKTSGGKSILMLQMAAEAIRQGKRVAVFSLELGVDEVVGRLVSFQQRIPISEIMKPATMTQGSFNKLKLACGDLENSGLFVCDNPDVTIDTISGHCLRLKETHGLDLVVIDYLQMVNVPHMKGQSREQEVASISRSCKQLAKRLKCPVLTATQLNNDGQSRESRAIEHDSDNVLMIDHENDEGDCTVKFWKCRNGQRGTTFSAQMNGLYQRFSNIEQM